MATYPDGTLLRASGPEVERMEGGKLRWIPDPPTFNCMGLNWGAIQTISDSEWNQIPKGAPYPSRADGTLLQGSGPQVYVMAGCQRHWIPDPDTFNAHGYHWDAIQHVSDTDLTAIAEGVQIPSSKNVDPTKTQPPSDPAAQLQLAQLQQQLQQQMAISQQQLANLISQMSTVPQDSQAMLELQQQMASYTLTAQTLSAQMKEISDTMKSIIQKIG